MNIIKYIVFTLYIFANYCTINACEKDQRKGKEHIAEPYRSSVPRAINLEALNLNNAPSQVDHHEIYINQKIERAYCQNPLDRKLFEHIKRNCPFRIKTMIDTLKDRGFSHRWPHFIILNGPTGVGKSTLVKFMAMELDWPYYIFSAASVANEYQHSGAQNIDRFANALAERHPNHPALCAFEEVNALVDKRSTKQLIDASTSGEFWVWLDSLSKSKNLVVVGTTNDMNKQRKQITGRGGQTIIDIDCDNNVEHTVKTIKFLIEPDKYDCSDAFLLAFGKKLTPSSYRTLEQIVTGAAQLAHERNWNVTILPSDFIHSLQFQRLAQRKRYGYMFALHRYLKKYNKYWHPLVSDIIAVSGTSTNIYAVIQQLKNAHEQLELGRDSANTGKLQLDFTRKADERANIEMDRAQAHREATMAQAQEHRDATSAQSQTHHEFNVRNVEENKSWFGMGCDVVKGAATLVAAKGGIMAAKAGYVFLQGSCNLM